MAQYIGFRLQVMVSGIRKLRCCDLKPDIKPRESNVIFVKFHKRLQSKDLVVVLVLVVVVLVLVLVPRNPSNSDFEDEHEDDDKNQI